MQASKWLIRQVQINYFLLNFSLQRVWIPNSAWTRGCLSWSPVHGWIMFKVSCPQLVMLLSVWTCRVQYPIIIFRNLKLYIWTLMYVLHLYGICLGWDLGSQPWNLRSQAMGSRSQQIFEGSGIRLCLFLVIRNKKDCHAFGFKDQKFGCQKLNQWWKNKPCYDPDV